MKKLGTFIYYALMFAVGSLLGHGAADAIFGPMLIHNRTVHVCQCEDCKTIRQLEAVEVVDSIIHDRIVITVNTTEE